MSGNIEFVDFDELFLNSSFIWLSDPEIKRLTMTPTISKEDQIEWFKGLKTRSDYYIRGITCDNKPIGAVGIKHISNNKGEYWGYIGDKDYIGRGIGKIMMENMCRYGLSIGLKRLFLHVAEFNTRAINLYNSFGFSVIETNNGVLKMEKVLG